MCSPQNRSQTQSMPQNEDAEKPKYEDKARIILIGKPIQVNESKNESEIQIEEQKVIIKQEKEQETIMYEEEKETDNYDIEVVRIAAGGGIHGIRALKKKILN